MQRFIFLLIALVSPSLASAQSVPDTLQRWGVMGSWLTDCAKPPGNGNTQYTYVRLGNDAFLNRDGGTFTDSNQITTALVRSDGMLEYHVAFKGLSDTRINVVMKGPDGRMRTMINSDLNGGRSVDNGVLVHNKQPTPWTTRCQ